MADENFTLGRRALLQLLPISLIAKEAPKKSIDHCGSPSSVVEREPYRLKFFTSDEVDLFNLVAEQMIPTDEHSPGAREAGVVEFADLMISTSHEDVQMEWRSGLQGLAEYLKQTDINAWLDQASEQEDNPNTVLDSFYRTVKHMTINGYYSSAVGIHQELEYQGNTYLASFQGCDHPEHQA